MTSEDLRIVADTYEEMLRMHQLNLELLETLELSMFWLKNSQYEHKIPFPQKEKMSRLLHKVSSVPQIFQLKNPIRRKETPSQSDAEETEPVLKNLISVLPIMAKGCRIPL